MKEIKTVFKFWFETEDGYIFGEGPFEILCKVRELKTLSVAAEALGMSYRHTWGIIKDIERRLGLSLLRTRKGGVKGGGGAVLTEDGDFLVNEYNIYKEAYSQVSQRLKVNSTNQYFWIEGILHGKVLKAEEGKPSIIEAEIDGGEMIKLILNEKQFREKNITLGYRLRLDLNFSLLADKIR